VCLSCSCCTSPPEVHSEHPFLLSLLPPLSSPFIPTCSFIRFCRRVNDSTCFYCWSSLCVLISLGRPCLSVNSPVLRIFCCVSCVSCYLTRNRNVLTLVLHGCFPLMRVGRWLGIKHMKWTRVLRKILGRERREVTGDEENRIILHNLNSSPNATG
jgi:hypothetical protein